MSAHVSEDNRGGGGPSCRPVDSGDVSPHSTSGSALHVECGGTTPLWTTGHDPSPPPHPPRDWHHAPQHRLSPGGCYIVTAATRERLPLLNTASRLELVRDAIWAASAEAGWSLEAWAVLPNHYHFVVQSAGGAGALSRWIGKVHMTTAKALNAADGMPGRRVWFQYWESQITWQRAYLARLKYVHRNPEKHGLVERAEAYPWCSAAWFAQHAEPSARRMLASLTIDAVNVPDDF